MSPLPNRFSGWTLVQGHCDDGQRAQKLVDFIEKYIDDEHDLVKELERIDFADEFMLYDYVQDLVELISAHAPDGTTFEYHDNGGCLGFWELVLYDPDRVQEMEEI